MAGFSRRYPCNTPAIKAGKTLKTDKKDVQKKGAKCISLSVASAS